MRKKHRRGRFVGAPWFPAISNTSKGQKDHKKQIVLINRGPIETTGFNLTKEKKEFLLASGKLATVDFVKKYYPQFDSSMYDPAELEKDVDIKLSKI